MKQLAACYAALGLAAACAAAPGHFYIEATLRDGQTVAGWLPAKRGTFEAVTVQGRTVRVRFGKLPSYVKRTWSQHIAWDEARGVFVVRASGWTGELKRIWEKLELDEKRSPEAPRADADELDMDLAAEEPKKIVIKGSDVAEARIRFVDPAKEAVKPGKRKK